MPDEMRENPEVRMVPLPREPTTAERALHAVTHLPPCSWCAICTKARGRDDAHHRAPVAERVTEDLDRVPVLEMDYTFFGAVTVLSVYMKKLHGGFSTIVEHKGAWPFAVGWVLDRLTWYGQPAVILRTVSAGAGHGSEDPEGGTHADRDGRGGRPPGDWRCGEIPPSRAR